MAGDDEKDVREVEEATSSGATAEGSDEVSKAGEEEDTGAQIAPIVTLQEVAVITGEENEDVLIDMWVELRLTLVRREVQVS